MGVWWRQNHTRRKLLMHKGTGSSGEIPKTKQSQTTRVYGSCSHSFQQPYCQWRHDHVLVQQEGVCMHVYSVVYGSMQWGHDLYSYAHSEEHLLFELRRYTDYSGPRNSHILSSYCCICITFTWARVIRTQQMQQMQHINVRRRCSCSNKCAMCTHHSAK